MKKSLNRQIKSYAKSAGFRRFINARWIVRSEEQDEPDQIPFIRACVMGDMKDHLCDRFGVSKHRLKVAFGRPLDVVMFDLV